MNCPGPKKFKLFLTEGQRALPHFLWNGLHLKLTHKLMQFFGKCG